MKQIFLKFADEIQADAVLSEFVVPTGGGIVQINGFSIDTIGVIYTQGDEPEPMDGWHVNMLVPDETPESLVPYVVVPNTPRRIFAGWDW